MNPVDFYQPLVYFENYNEVINMDDKASVKSTDGKKNTAKSEKIDMNRYKDYVVPKEILERPGELEYIELIRRTRAFINKFGPSTK